MNVQIRAKDLTLTDNTRSHIQTAIDNFERYKMDITTVNVILKKEKKGVHVEFDIHIAHNEPVVIGQSDNDLDTAIDLAIDRANKALRRLHDKVTSHRGSSLKDMVEIESE